MNKPSDKFVLVCTGVFLSLIIIYTIAKFVFKFDANDLSTLTNFFVASATFIAAFTAVILFTDWRDEKNYELEHNYLKSILSNLVPIHTELITIRSESLSIKSVDENFVVYTSFINRKRLDIYYALINLYPDIKIYSKLKTDPSLETLYFKFDKYCFCLDTHFKNLTYNLYKDYYKKCEQQAIDFRGFALDEYAFQRPYTENRKQSLKSEIFHISHFFEHKCKCQIGDSIIYIYFNDLIDKTIDIHNEIIEYCIENLKPK